MTIRDYIKRRYRWTFAVAIGGWLMFPLSMGFGEDHRELQPLVILGVLLFGGAIVYAAFGIKCPRCRTRYGQIGMEIAFYFGSGTRRRVNFCPYCGVSLDEPLDGPR